VEAFSEEYFPTDNFGYHNFDVFNPIRTLSTYIEIIARRRMFKSVAHNINAALL
jgi:hypothetical protein